MKMDRKNKAGFTLIELMVVAIIVAILAAVAIPLMSANKKRAMATEAQAGCGAVKTALRVMQAEGDSFPAAGSATAVTAIKGVGSNDLNGTYFQTTDYKYTGSGYSNWTVTATGSTGDVNTLTVTLDQSGAFGGTLLQ